VQLAVSLVLLVPYCTELEVWLYPSPEDFSAHPLLLNRIFTYTTGLVKLHYEITSYAVLCIRKVLG
jgi:hypothetical protein